LRFDRYETMNHDSSSSRDHRSSGPATAAQATASPDEPGEPPSRSDETFRPSDQSSKADALPPASPAAARQRSGTAARLAGLVRVAVANRQNVLAIDEDRLAQAVVRVLTDEGKTPAEVSLAVVDNEEIHRLNAQFLEHDYPTDALSFVLDEGPSGLEGEIIVSAEMAAQQAGRFGWEGGDELLLYVIHAALHLAGYDDLEPETEPVMRARERHYLAVWGLTPGPATSPEDGSGDTAESHGQGKARSWGDGADART